MNIYRWDIKQIQCSWFRCFFTRFE